MLSFSGRNHSTQQTETQPTAWDLLLPCGKDYKLTKKLTCHWRWEPVDLFDCLEGNNGGYISNITKSGGHMTQLLEAEECQFITGFFSFSSLKLDIFRCFLSVDCSSLGTDVNTDYKVIYWAHPTGVFFVVFFRICDWVGQQVFLAEDDNNSVTMNLTQRIKLLKHFGSVPPEPPPPLLVVPVSGCIVL